MFKNLKEYIDIKRNISDISLYIRCVSNIIRTIHFILHIKRQFHFALCHLL
jgi:hypothetical protein